MKKGIPEKKGSAARYARGNIALNKLQNAHAYDICQCGKGKPTPLVNQQHKQPHVYTPTAYTI